MSSSALVAETEFEALEAELIAMTARINQFTSAIAAFLLSVQSQVAQYAATEAIDLSNWITAETGIVDSFVSQLTLLVDGYMQALQGHLNAYSPDQTHNGALDPNSSMGAQYRPLPSAYFPIKNPNTYNYLTINGVNYGAVYANGSQSGSGTPSYLYQCGKPILNGPQSATVQGPTVYVDSCGRPVAWSTLLLAGPFGAKQKLTYLWAPVVSQ